MEKSLLTRRIPPYVFTQLDGKKAKLQNQGINYIDFGMGNPDMAPADIILEDLKIHTDHIDLQGYAPSSGIPMLKEAISKWYESNYDVNLDPESQTIVTIGSKEGLAHLALATTGPEDLVLIPEPCYPIHKYAFSIAGATVQSYNALNADNLLEELNLAIKTCWPRPKFLVLNFPSNPTTQCINLETFAKIIQLAKKEKIWVIQDLAYADLIFDKDRAPSILQVPGATDIAVETFTMSKSFNMAGWRIGFMCGNKDLIAALKHIKNYMDYGTYQPLQRAAAKALLNHHEFVTDNKQIYRTRRDKLCASLASAGWEVTVPQATMFVWAKIPPQYLSMGSLKFAEALLEYASVAVTPGIFFGSNSNEYVRFSLIHEDKKVNEACLNIKNMFEKRLGLEKAQKNVA